MAFIFIGYSNPVWQRVRFERSTSSWQPSSAVTRCQSTKAVFFAVLAALLAENRTRCSPPKPDGEVADIVSYVFEKPVCNIDIINEEASKSLPCFDFFDDGVEVRLAPKQSEKAILANFKLNGFYN